MKILNTVEFGNPVLRRKAKTLTQTEIESRKIKSLINDMRHTLTSKKLGVAIAAPQVGKSLALSVIAVRPTAHRPKVKKFDLVIINPSYKGVGDKKEM